jgi:hypothetical protein
MSSIDQARERELRAFFDRYLLPAAEASRAEGRVFFPLGPEPAASTYYRRRDDRSDYVFDLETVDAAGHLAALWSDQPELLALVRPLLQLAETLTQNSDSSSEVSPFVYAMF